MSLRSRVWQLALVVPLVAGPVFAQDIVVLTGGTSGVYYPLGVQLAKIFERDIEGSNARVVSTQATVENLNLLEQGKGVVALAQGNILRQAWKGDPEFGFPGPRAKIRLIGAAHPDYIHVIARRELDIRSVHDLRGRRVSVGAARSGNELSARALLGAADISYADLLQVQFLAYGPSVERLVKGQLDAVIISAGLGVAAVRRVASQIAVDFVPVDRRLIEKTRGMFYAVAIPAGHYPGQTQQVETAADGNYFVTTIEASEDLVYRMTRATYESLKELQTAHPAAAAISAERALELTPIPVHPGALRYFREVGLIR